MNPTDKQKLVIHKMFAEPIDEVEIAIHNLIRTYDEEFKILYAGEQKRVDVAAEYLQQKIDNLKSMLPVIQETP